VERGPCIIHDADKTAAMETHELSPTRSKSLIGAAGVHCVAAELSLRGLIALPTIRNTAGTDIVVTNQAGTWFANLQVKTSRSRVAFWPLSTHFESWTGPNDYYVFLRWLKLQDAFEIFCESAKAVAKRAASTLKAEKARRGGLAWGPCFHLKTDAERLRRNWTTFGIAHVSTSNAISK
jgi:hypothetical protein